MADREKIAEGLGVVRMTQREEKARIVYRYMRMIYCVISAALVLIYALRHDSYHLSISIGTFAFPILLELVWKLPFLKRVWQIDCMILGFIFLGYPLGSCVDLFTLFPGYDKVVHTLSGVFVSVLALILYYVLKPEHRMEKRDSALAVAFMLTASIAVAGLWEIGEYLLSGIVGWDLQQVLTTGVADSMQDMIVCTLGTLATVPAALHGCSGKPGFLSGIVRDFVAAQFPEP